MIFIRGDADYQDYKYRELTEKIIEIYYRVYNKPGYGFLEKIYENAMMIELKKENKYQRLSAKICVMICINKDYRI